MAIVWSFSTAFYIFIWEILQASLVAQMLNNLPAMWEMCVQSLGWEDPMEKGTATHSSILAWRNPWTEEPGGLQSMSCKESDMNEQLSLLHLWEPLLYRLGKMKLVLGSQPCPSISHVSRPLHSSRWLLASPTAALRSRE